MVGGVTPVDPWNCVREGQLRWQKLRGRRTSLLIVRDLCAEGVVWFNWTWGEEERSIDGFGSRSGIFWIHVTWAKKLRYLVYLIFETYSILASKPLRQFFQRSAWGVIKLNVLVST
jgi:hypothetical protein